MTRRSWFLATLLAACAGAQPSPQIDGAGDVRVIASKLRAGRGDTVQITVRAGGGSIQARVMEPNRGVRELPLTPRGNGVYDASLSIPENSADGLYIVTVQEGTSVAKASVLVGQLVGDCYVVSLAAQEPEPEKDLPKLVGEFRQWGGNFWVAHVIMDSRKAYYASKICKTDATLGSREDHLGYFLTEMDKAGMPVMISVTWDMTRPLPYTAYTESLKSVMREVWELYGSHPSMAGFYSYQEGSGTYFASYVREFCDAAKSLDPGLLTMCAPYVDDPLLSGYLAAIDSLDIFNYQGAVMASYRPDVRQCYPLRRVKDFMSVMAGATRVKGKLALNHVEYFGYMELALGGHYLASESDIVRQLMSAATCPSTDGFMVHTYHYNGFLMPKKIPEAKVVLPAAIKGEKAYKVIQQVATQSNTAVFFYPYHDWCVERWQNCFVPALDAFRRLGMPADVVPFIPKKGEDVLPYYPLKLNEEQLEFFLKNRHVLILPDISGMQDTDSILIKTFVERGGVAVMFGPRIPWGDCFKRPELCGGTDRPAARRGKIEIQAAEGSRMKAGTSVACDVESPSWIPSTARTIAAFDDGSAAVAVNTFGKGKVYVVSLSATDAVRCIPELLRDMFDAAAEHGASRRPFDFYGVHEDIDMAVSTQDGEYRLALVNHQGAPMDVTVVPLTLDPNATYRATDLAAGRTLFEKKGGELAKFPLSVPGHGFVAIALRRLP